MNHPEPGQGEEVLRQVPLLEEFALAVLNSYKPSPFHSAYYKILEKFAQNKIRKLIISVPPQHGKSLGASVLLPAYMLGLDPDRKIALASYNATLATRFNKRVQRIIDNRVYQNLFPDTKIKQLSAKSDYVRTSNHFEVIGRSGELISVGREGSLTGTEVDIFILDDLYKDAMEANSPLIRENCLDWYTSVVRTRLHNDSSEIIVFTRWHEEDLIGTLLEKEKHVHLKEWGQLECLDQDTWLVVNFEAIKESEPTEVDPRSPGDPLWPLRHNKELLEGKRVLDPQRFNCMYQGKPSVKEGLLYGNRLRTYEQIPEAVVRKGNYTDTADLGDDFLCSICYDICTDGKIYITDILYSQDGMEVTEKLIADMLQTNDTRYSYIESNNGGRGFARAVAKMVPNIKISWFHQSGNKEARILSNSATVIHNVLFPASWHITWPQFHYHISTYKRNYRTNRWHDGPDVLTGIVEKEIVYASGKKIKGCY